MFIYQVERELITNLIAKYAHLIKGKTLDVGAGSIKRYKSLYKHITNYTSLDIDAASKPDIIGDAQKIPVPDNSFDSIVMVQVLHDVYFPDKAIKELNRVVKKKGVVMVAAPYLSAMCGDATDYWRFTPNGLTALFKDNNFKIEHLETRGRFFSVIVQMTTRLFINSLDLYNRKILGRIFSLIFFIFGKLAIFLDEIMDVTSNKKYGLVTILVARKI
ncbi:MAG: class I SAM-dependent methyltransferase [bacterium]|nr:class I SAM-dependent methyltransferase [bacterium]